jgi:hypothetical protein
MAASPLVDGSDFMLEQKDTELARFPRGWKKVWNCASRSGQLGATAEMYDKRHRLADGATTEPNWGRRLKSTPRSGKELLAQDERSIKLHSDLPMERLFQHELLMSRL